MKTELDCIWRHDIYKTKHASKETMHHTVIMRIETGEEMENLEVLIGFYMSGIRVVLKMNALDIGLTECNEAKRISAWFCRFDLKKSDRKSTLR